MGAERKDLALQVHEQQLANVSAASFVPVESCRPVSQLERALRQAASADPSELAAAPEFSLATLAQHVGGSQSFQQQSKLSARLEAAASRLSAQDANADADEAGAPRAGSAHAQAPPADSTTGTATASPAAIEPAVLLRRDDDLRMKMALALQSSSDTDPPGVLCQFFDAGGQPEFHGIVTELLRAHGVFSVFCRLDELFHNITEHKQLAGDSPMLGFDELLQVQIPVETKKKNEGQKERKKERKKGGEEEAEE